MLLLGVYGGCIKSEDEWNITAFVSACVAARFILTINRPINSLPEPQLETLFRSPSLRHCNDHDHFGDHDHRSHRDHCCDHDYRSHYGLCDDHDHFSDFGDHDDFVSQELVLGFYG